MLRYHKILSIKHCHLMRFEISTSVNLRPKWVNLRLDKADFSSLWVDLRPKKCMKGYGGENDIFFLIETLRIKRFIVTASILQE